MRHSFNCFKKIGHLFNDNKNKGCFFLIFLLKKIDFVASRIGTHVYNNNKIEVLILFI